MDNIINLYQRKTWKTIFITKSKNIQKKKIREEENWSFEENAH